MANNKILKNIYLFFISVCLIEAVLYVLFIDTRGYFYYVSVDNKTLGGDFYLSLLLSNNLTPYENQTPLPYSPLISLLFNFLYLIGDGKKLGIIYNDVGMYLNNIIEKHYTFRLMCLMFIIISFVLIFYSIYKVIEKNEKNEIYKFFISIFMLCNPPLLSGIERANIIIISVPFLILFVLYYKSSLFFYRIIALVSLIISFHIKLYTCIFGILLLWDKQYKTCIKVVIFALLTFTIPFLFLNGGFLHNVSCFFNNFSNFALSESLVMIGGRELPLLFVKFLNTVFKKNYESGIFPTVFSFVISIILFIKGFYIKENWKKVLTVSLIVFFISYNFPYVLIYIMLPFVFFITEENKPSKTNIIILFLFIFLLAPYVVCFKYNTIMFRIILDNIILFLFSVFILFENIKKPNNI